MAKGAISKKRKAPSVHSRAARRATSPSIDTDKSLKNVKPPAESIDHRPSVLAIHQGAGVSKKTTKSRNMSSKARRRHEKGQDRAANIMERTERKIAKSKGQARTIQTRRKAWDEINNQIPANKSESQGEVDNGEDELSELDEEMDDAQLDKAHDGATSADKVPLQEVEDDDEIL
ncbi:Alb1-domain-containing protein [Daldinia vernicosa]|uniref:Alb1-domain-containing protein n=1 Tax=Daldinia vernicosa TaxID=114800 RepID=UPI0020076C62|nr:Alb1-domain-containing protein [Daldinia vernicosa]KAI0852172.1 Alb1-domain-containing protein [Daldinia vernicosa]